MAQVPQKLSDEAAKRGSVEGANFQPATDDEYRGTVNNPSRWYVDSKGSVWNATPDDIVIFWHDKNRWASVISPAPSKEEEGLKEGDACECGPAMRAAIVELANELGLLVYAGVTDQPVSEYPNPTWAGNAMDATYSTPTKHSGLKTWYTPEAFIAKMRATAAKPKPIKIKVGAGNNCGEWEVKHEKGRVKIGECTYVDNATIRSIAEKLID